MRGFRVCVFVLFAPLSLAIGCSSSSSPAGQGCNENPWECPAGQTCWPKDQTSFACFRSGQGAAGEACENSVGAATCGDGLACLETGTAASGTCSAFCDSTNPSHACSAGETCRMAILLGVANAQFQVCVSTSASTTDGGDESSSPAFEAGGSVDAGVLTGDGAVPAD